MKKLLLVLMSWFTSLIVCAQTWTGSVNTDWNNPANWSTSQVPTQTSFVTIPSGLLNYPVLTANVEIGRLVLQAGCTIDFANYVLYVNSTSTSGFSTLDGATLRSSSGQINLIINNGVSGYYTSMSNCIIENNLVLSLEGSNNFTEGSGGGNTFLGNTSITISGSGDLIFGGNAASSYSGNLSITRTAAGGIELFKTIGSVIQGNLSVSNPFGGGVLKIGNTTTSSTINGTVNIFADYQDNPNSFELHRIINHTTGGKINVLNSRGFNLRNDTLKVDSLRINGFRGASYSYLYDNTIHGVVQLADTVTNTSGYNTYSRHNVFNGNVHHTRNGDVVLYISDVNGSEDVYNGNLTIQVNGNNNVSIGNGDVVEINGDFLLNRVADGTDNLFKNAANVSNNFTYTQSGSTGNTYIGNLAGGKVAIGGNLNINIDKSSPGEFVLDWVENVGNAGAVILKGTKGVQIINDTLKLTQFNIQDVQGSDFSKIYNNKIDGNFSFSDHASYTSGYSIYVRNSRFNGNCEFTVNGSNAFIVSDLSDSDLYFNGNLSIHSVGNHNIHFGTGAFVSVAGNLNFTKASGTSGSNQLFVSKGGFVGGDLNYTISASSATTEIGTNNYATSVVGKLQINVNNDTRANFGLYRVLNNQSGGLIQLSNTKGLSFEKDTILANIIIDNVGGSSFSTMYDNQINGTVSFTPSATDFTSGYHAYFRNNIFNGDVTLQRKGNNNVYDSDNGIGNIYNGNVTYINTNEGSGSFVIGNVQNQYNGNLTVDNDFSANPVLINRALLSSDNGSNVDLENASVNYLTVNTSEVRMLKDITVNNTLTFVSGLILPHNTSPASLLRFKSGSSFTGASLESHAKSVVVKEGNSAFTFPTGSGTLYAPVSMTAPAIGSSFSAAYYNDDVDAVVGDTSARASGIRRVSGSEYWSLARLEGSSTPVFTFSFNDPAPGVANYITDPSTVRIVRWNGSQWDDKGNNGYTGSTTGTVTAGGAASDFGDFTFGTTNEGTNPLMTQTFVYYLDSDGDGFGDLNQFINSGNPTPPNGYVLNNTDCDDNDNTVYPGAPELCDGKDNDCDGQIDEDNLQTWYRDADGDGFGNAIDFVTNCAQPVGYVANNTDCNDNDNTVYPGAPELCDGKDNDCNGLIDDTVVTSTFYRDADGDGYGDVNDPVQSCSQPSGYVSNSNDCNDNDNTIYPGAPELCDGKDNDCNGLIDDGVGATWYIDSDGDGFGDVNTSTVSCTQPTGYVTNSLDCDDADNTVYPGAPELCDGKDNDCDGQIDEDGGVTWYLDNDGDGHGDASVSVVNCTQPVGYVSNNTDCDDNDNTVYPGAPELCDGIDNDCNGIVDDGAGSFDISSSASAGGTISPSGTVSVSCGDDITYTITADAGYNIGDVLVDGISVGAVSSFTFNHVYLNHSISVSFVPVGTQTYSITASAGTGGVISPAGINTVNAGDELTFNITADACNVISDVLVDGVSVGAVDTYTFNDVMENHTIEAQFEYMPVPGPFTGIINVCDYEGTNQSLTYSVPQWPGVTYEWIVPPTTTLLSGQGTNTIDISINNGFGASANKQIRVRAVYACGSTVQSIYYLRAEGPMTPGFITSTSDDICASIANGNTITYTIAPVLNASGYNWNISNPNVSIQHPNGIGVNDTTILVTYLNGYNNGTLTVQAYNNCGTSPARSMSITSNVPSVPGVISGPTNACPHTGNDGTVAIYSIASVNGATDYIWNLPAGATDVTGLGTNVVSFKYPVGYAGGSISVSASNGCGTGAARTLRISSLTPGAPGNIVATLVNDCPVKVYTYTLVNMPSGSNWVTWTVPAGGTIINGQGTGSITVEYASSVSVSGQVTAQGISGCGSSSIRKLNVQIDACNVGVGKQSYVNASTDDALEVQVFPNPSRGAFNLKTSSAKQSVLRINILDLSGRVLISTSALSGQLKVIDNNLRPGLYIMEIIQGSSKTTTRILKQ